MIKNKHFNNATILPTFFKSNKKNRGLQYWLWIVLQMDNNITCESYTSVLKKNI